MYLCVSIITDNIKPVIHLTHRVSVFDEEVVEFRAVECMVQFVQYVDSMASCGLMMEGNNIMLSYCVWDFFDLVSIHLTCVRIK